jgi:hypothetical protein
MLLISDDLRLRLKTAMAQLRLKLFLYLAICTLPLLAQGPNKRLILKDGSYQIVRQYEIKGNIVRYLSAERGGWEELPKDLVDWPATERYAREHVPGSSGGSTPANAAAAEIDREEQQARAEEAARMPEVITGLQLPDLDGVFALDTYRDKPELIEVTQSTGDVNRNMGHNILRSTINPLAGQKLTLRINGAKSKVRLHVPDPALYVSLEEADKPNPDSTAFPVDTHGASSVKGTSGSSPDSHYAIIRLEQRKDSRNIGSINVSLLGKVSQSENMIDTTSETLPGGHWMKLVPKQPLQPGEYALIEILSPKEINLSVWDFAVDPTAPENANARLPREKAR